MKYTTKAIVYFLTSFLLLIVFFLFAPMETREVPPTPGPVATPDIAKCLSETLGYDSVTKRGFPAKTFDEHHRLCYSETERTAHIGGIFINTVLAAIMSISVVVQMQKWRALKIMR